MPHLMLQVSINWDNRYKIFTISGPCSYHLRHLRTCTPIVIIFSYACMFDLEGEVLT